MTILDPLANVHALSLTGYVYVHQIIHSPAFGNRRLEIFDKDCPVVSNGGKKMQVVKDCALSHIHNVDRHSASPNVVISLQIICLPLDGSCISTHSSTIFPSVLTAPNFIALCQSGLKITVTDTHPAHFREIISMPSVQHVATQHQSLAQDHYQKLLPLWPGHSIPAI